MKGKTLVIGIIVFVLLIVGAISFAMMSTINKIKEENENEIENASIHVLEDEEPLFTLVDGVDFLIT